MRSPAISFNIDFRPLVGRAPDDRGLRHTHSIAEAVFLSPFHPHHRHEHRGPAAWSRDIAVDLPDERKLAMREGSRILLS